MHDLIAVFETLWQIVVLVLSLIAQLLALLLQSALLVFWLAWALLGIHWPKAWEALRQGAWAPTALVLVLIAIVWSQVLPSECGCLGFVIVPNFWWQLGAVALVASLTLTCGWLQGLLGWTPATIDLEPAEAHHNAHGH